MLPVASCNRNWHKFLDSGPFWLVFHFNFLFYLFISRVVVVIIIIIIIIITIIVNYLS